ncbi:MAG: apolipoprotein N-acyltransferase [Candidatus Sumerlaeia bacterium]|nr:apolipoprotein N-acyltransferase [Candidatus Sumerlaeia bacterium]
MLAFWAGMVFGMINGYHILGWMTSVSRFNAFVYLGLLPACALWGVHRALVLGVMAWMVRRVDAWIALPLGGLIFAGMEYFQSVGAFAFPVGFVAHGFGGWTSFAVGTSLFGTGLLTLVAVMVNLGVMESIAAFQKNFGKWEALSRLAISILLAGLVWYYGSGQANRIAAELEEHGVDVRVALVQTGIDQAIKFESYTSPDDARRFALQNQMFASLLEQISTIERGSVDLIVTPESSLTHDFVDVEPHFQRQTIGYVPFEDLKELANDIEAPIVVGGIDYLFRNEDGEFTELLAEGVEMGTGMLRPGYRVFGGLWVIRPGQQGISYTADYRKMQLMPFGETVPYFDVIPGFRENLVQIGNFDRGAPGPPIGVPLPAHVDDEEKVVRMGPSICFEDLFPWIHRHHVREGANLFVNTTNDGWFDGSNAAELHMSGARWRVFETGVPMVRATNTGKTVIIDALGRVTEILPKEEPGILEATVRIIPDPARTLFVRIGDWFGFLAFWISVLVCFAVWRGERRVPRVGAAP